MKLHSLYVPAMAVLLAGLSSSCNKELETELNDISNNGSSILSITTSICDSRQVITDSNFSTGDEIGLYVYNLNNTAYYDGSLNVKATYGMSKWKISKNILLNQSYANVYAYYPYIENPRSENEMEINIDISPNGDKGQPDFMYASDSKLNSADLNANLYFEHVLTRITVKIKKSDDDKGAGKLSRVTLENDTLFLRENTIGGVTDVPQGKGDFVSTKGILSLSTGEVSAVSYPDAKISFDSDALLDTKNYTQFEFLVIPAEARVILPTNQIRGKACLNLLIDGKTHRVDLGYPQWLAGKQYIYEITVSRE